MRTLEIPVDPSPLGDRRGAGPLIGTSRAMQRLQALLERIAPTDRPVLLHGPTGCGKEVVAQEIHRLGSNPQAPFVELNCSAIPETLLEGELFGHEKGAFTGAVSTRSGHLARVGQGTLFLDEIGDMPLSLQPKLLRVLESRRFHPLGASQGKCFEGRIVAATHRDLAAMVREGTFREDLFYRLNVFVLEIPPLDQRREDIPLLCEHFAERQPRPIRFAPEALETLARLAWPGNVRQVRNLVERLSVLSDAALITPGVLCGFLESEEEPAGDDLDELLTRLLRVDAEDKISALEHLLVDKVLRDCEGNKTAAARLLGVNRKVVERRVQAQGEHRREAQRRLDHAKEQLARSELVPAEQDLRRALESMRSLPRDEAVQRLRFGCLSRLAICARSREGWMSAEASNHNLEALKVGRALGLHEELAPVLFGLWTVDLMGLALEDARRSAEELQVQAEASRDPGLLLDGHIAVANTHFWLGEFQTAWGSLQALRALPGFESGGITRQGFDPLDMGTMLEGLVAFQLGAFRTAREALDRLRTRSGAGEHAFSQAIRLQAVVWLEYLFQDEDEMGRHARELVQLGEAEGYLFYAGLGKVFLGYRQGLEGKVDAAVRLLQEGYQQGMLKHGGFLFHSVYARLLARLHLSAGRWAEAEDVLTRALLIAQERRERAYLPELLCLQAHLLAARGFSRRAEQAFLHAHGTAQALGSIPGRIEAALGLCADGRHPDLLLPLLRSTSQETLHPGLARLRALPQAAGMPSPERFAPCLTHP